MPRIARVPSMTLHRPSGNARVRLAGHDVYLGPWGTPQAEAEYRRVVAEWLASGVVPTRSARSASNVLTVGELARTYKDHLLQSMTKREYQQTVRPTLRRLDALYGHTRAGDFSPSSLEALLRASINEVTPRGTRLSRAYINRKLLPRVKRLFKWAAHNKLIPSSVWHDLCTVERVKRGLAGVRDLEPIGPVPDAIVDATLPHLPPVIADMVRVQRLTGMRPCEVCLLNWGNVDRSTQVWMFRPTRHKTMHHGKSREIPIGPKAQAFLLKYLMRPADRPLFSPADSEQYRKARARQQRKTRVQPSQQARDEQAAQHPRCAYHDGYSPAVYCRAVARAVKRAFRPVGMSAAEFSAWKCPQHWHPNQLRHTRATEIRAGFGLDAAGAVLGHAKLDTTQIYAERNRELASRIALATG